MLSILGFIIILGPLVIFHEFGHYIFAKLFNVKAEIFSVGFGPRLVAKQIGETEFRISAIPLGGYVKLLGEDPETELPTELKDRSLQSKEAWKRFLIFFGGPLFNLILAVLVFMVILAIGEPHFASVAGRVIPGSDAARAGLVSGDRILSVDGEPISKYSEFDRIVNESPNRPLALVIQRDPNAEPFDVVVTPSSKDGYSLYGEEKPVGEIKGLFSVARASSIGVSRPDTAAAKAGLKTGQFIKTLNGVEVKNWEVFESLYADMPMGSKLEMILHRAKEDGTAGEEFSVLLKKPESSSGEPGKDLGIHSSEMFVQKVVPESPAEKAGLQQGDRITQIDGKKLISFYHLKDLIQNSAKEEDGSVEVAWERNGEVFEKTIVPNETIETDPLLKKTKTFTIGVMPKLMVVAGDTVIEREFNPFLLVYKATVRMLDFTWMNALAIGKMITGDVSVKTLGGPILIGQLAGESLARGLVSFLNMMAILSVGLGILNLLPIPVLDGGHLMLLSIEMVRGKPLTVRQMEIVQQVGLSLILMLMAVVLRNDLARLPIFD